MHDPGPASARRARSPVWPAAALADHMLVLAPGNRLLVVEPAALGPLRAGGREPLRDRRRPRPQPQTAAARRPPTPHAALHCAYELGGRALAVGYGDAASQGLADPLWSQYRRPAASAATPPPELLVARSGIGDGYCVVRKGRTLMPQATPAEAKGLLTRRLVEMLHGQRRWLAVLHASAVAGPQGVIAFPASPMSGKSTLAAALARCGFRHFADDCLPVARSDGRARSVPAAVSLREGSWPVLARQVPELAALPVHQVGDERVRYWFAHPASQVRAEAAPIRCLVFPRYEAGRDVALARLSPVQALVRLVESGSGPQLPLDAGGLAGFADWLAATPAYTLNYGTLDGAVAAVRGLAAQ